MWYLQLRMYLLIALLFAIVYAIIAFVSRYIGITNFYFYIVLASVLMFIQYMLGPKLVEWSMRVKYVEKAGIHSYTRLLKTWPEKPAYQSQE